jgi:hypothetical protein
MPCRGLSSFARISVESIGKGLEMQTISLGGHLRKAVVVATLFGASLPLYGCYTPGERAVGGGIIGGLGGAGIGALASGGMAGPTLAGAAIGAAGGALVGAATAPRPHYYYRRPRHYYY